MNIIVLESNIYSEEQLKYFTFFELKKLKKVKYFNYSFQPFLTMKNNIHFGRCLTTGVNMTLNFCSLP